MSLKRFILLTGSYCQPCRVLKDKLSDFNLPLLEVIDTQEPEGMFLVDLLEIKTIPTIVVIETGGGKDTKLLTKIQTSDINKVLKLYEETYNPADFPTPTSMF